MFEPYVVIIRLTAINKVTTELHLGLRSVSVHIFFLVVSLLNVYG